MKNEHLDGNTFILKGTLKVSVVLVHGFTSTTEEVRPLAEELNRTGYSVYCPLLPGHNTSPKDLNTKSWKDWTTCVEIVLEKALKNSEKVFIGGESMGAIIACYLASYYKNINGVILFSPALIVPKLHWSYVIKFFKPYMQKSYINKADENTELFPWKGYTVNPTQGAYQLFLLQQKVKHRLPNITKPIIIFQGKKDHTINPQGVKNIFNHVHSKNKQLILKNYSGHCIILDQEFQDVVKDTKKFLLDCL